jgi:hypothetical protein
MSAERALLAGVLLLWGAGALADELPDEAFLDYLGSWEESDDEWLMFDEMDAAETDDQADGESDPAPQGEESTETEDEN